jgi:4-hydroxy-tetrahydrodipicolinate reductase
MKIAVSGYGLMGQRIVSTITQLEDELVGIIDELSTNTFSFFHELRVVPDVIIDFSHPSQLKHLLDYAVSNHVPIMIGTTGYSDQERQSILDASSQIPIFHTSNTSLGVQVLLDTVQTLKNALPDADIELIETHHRYKEDAPSGTARMILNALSADQIVFGREGSSKRTTSEIGVHSIRGGSVAGVHEVQFLLDDEVITISHRAESKQVFVNGALKAARFIAKQQPGYYTMNHLLEGDNQ